MRMNLNFELNMNHLLAILRSKILIKKNIPSQVLQKISVDKQKMSNHEENGNFGS